MYKKRCHGKIHGTRYADMFFLIHPEVELHGEHGFMIGLVELDILQVLNDGFLVGAIAAR